MPGGIPNRTNIFCNVRVSIPGSSIVAQGDNVTDDTQAIQEAINLCPSNQVVYLPTGTYRISSRIVSQFKGHFTLRGDGPGLTVLSAAPTNAQNSILNFGASEWTIPLDRVKNWTAGYTKGTTNLTLRDVSGIQVNDLLLLDQLSDTNMVSPSGTGGTVQFADRPHNGSRTFQQYVKVKKIVNTTVTVDPPLMWTYSASLGPQAVRMLYTIRGVGIEDLTLHSTVARGGNNFYFDTAESCWIKNVESKFVHGTHIFFYQSLNCEVRDSYIHDSHNYTVNQGYGIEARKSTSLLIENNILYRLYSSLMLNSGSAGCVVGYNLVNRTVNVDPAYMIYSFSGSHGSHPIMNLWEGNVGGRFHADYYWGSSSHHTLLRNNFTGTDVGITQNRSAISLDGLCLSNNIVGNVLGSPDIANWIYEQTANAYPHTDSIIYRLGYPNMGNNRFSPLDKLPFYPVVAATLLRHGNYDYSTRSTNWTSSITDRSIPVSYYKTSKPAWWGSLRWPAIGPDLSPMVTKIPAQDRFDRLMSEAATRPQPPAGLRVVVPAAP